MCLKIRDLLPIWMMLSPSVIISKAWENARFGQMVVTKPNIFKILSMCQYVDVTLFFA